MIYIYIPLYIIIIYIIHVKSVHISLYFHIIISPKFTNILPKTAMGSPIPLVRQRNENSHVSCFTLVIYGNLKWLQGCFHGDTLW